MNTRPRNRPVARPAAMRSLSRFPAVSSMRRPWGSADRRLIACRSARRPPSSATARRPSVVSTAPGRCAVSTGPAAGLTVMARRVYRDARSRKCPMKALLRVVPAGDGMAAVAGAPPDDELAHADVEAGQVAHDAAVGDEHERRTAQMRADGLPDLRDLALAALGVVQRALQRLPRLYAATGEPRRLEAAAARAREDVADGDPVLAKRLADPRGLRPAAVVQVALRRAVLELRVGRVERPGGIAVAEDDHAAGFAHR